ncbi:TetR/AcrR family transcriptional regulator [Paenibacillus guangzhouensis]|uniref:TetR/AcrR family transcriptional regulator n=1 Tax=Paenibacillus guangzhouensis TaxID=1473112 RepID=UPI0012672DF6|nr:TetR/AcrR family transcriptional regulator [Paenibacillus guangzhouensis]
MQDSNNRIDPRIVRTKQMILQALLALMEEKGFDNTTIADITQRAGLNRGTFYLHYRDKFELLAQAQAEMLEGLTNRVGDVNPIALLQGLNTNEPFEPIVCIFDYFIEHADFFRVMFGPKGDHSFAITLRNLMGDNIYKKIIAVHLREEQLLIPRDYLITYITSANLGIILYWFENGMKLNSHEMALMMTRIMRWGPLQSSGLLDALSAPNEIKE